ncbi:hypothetical protein ANO11243_003400 [Dothideomycetidae sp. 11243]|nr:hypothetical protein ANO11243_003400 [fungal sp. No.11243]
MEERALNSAWADPVTDSATRQGLVRRKHVGLRAAMRQGGGMFKPNAGKPGNAPGLADVRRRA